MLTLIISVVILMRSRTMWEASLINWREKMCPVWVAPFPKLHLRLYKTMRVKWAGSWLTAVIQNPYHQDFLSPIHCILELRVKTNPFALSCLHQVFYYSNSKVSLSLHSLGLLGAILRARILTLAQREQLSIWTEFLSADFSSLCSLLSFQAWTWCPDNALFSRHWLISFILSYNEGQEWLRVKNWQPWNYPVFRQESLSLPFLSDVLIEF